MLRRAVASLVLLAVPLAAGGQTMKVDRPRAAIGAPGGSPDAVRVQVTVNFFVAGPTNDSDASLQAQEHARRAIYQTAGRKCEALRATIAEECRLETANVTINRQWMPQQQEGFTVGGNLTFRVTLK
jgi:hypothetical protein